MRLIHKYLFYLMASALFIFVNNAANSAECRKIGSTCVQGPEKRNINGGEVFRQCWKYQDTYECIHATNLDYCAAINSIAGCYQSHSVCEKKAFNGMCEVYRNTYRCNKNQGTPAGTIKLADTHTIVQDTVDRLKCSDVENNNSCTLAENKCVVPGGTRLINGVPVTKDCWEWEEAYTCLTANHQNYCTPLRQTAECTEIDNTCLKTGWNGSCMEYERKYRCGEKLTDPLPEKVEFLETTYSILQDELDKSQCNVYSTNQNCTLASHTCIQPGGTRNINGLDVYKDCWEWKDDYVCASTKLKNDCGEIFNNSACSEESSACIDKLPDGSCGLRERKFKCKTKEESQEEIITCDSGICYNGQCSAPSTEPDSDFFKTITAMETSRQMGTYFESNELEIFKGVSDTCKVKLGGASNCCRAKGGGGDSNNSFLVSSVKEIGKGLGKEGIRFLGSPYMYDTLYSLDLIPTSLLNSLYGPATILESGSEFVFGASTSAAGSAGGAAGGSAGGAAGGSAGGSAGGGGGNLSFYGISYAPGMSPPFAFDPTSFAIAIAMQVVTQYMQCDQSEQVLGMRKGQNLCTYVGSWCSKKVLGACVEKKESYCCYNSRMSRIFNEQGRLQLGKDYGDITNPQCNGFNVTELSRLDMSQMDMSEFYSEIIPKQLDETKLNIRAQERVMEKTRSYFED